MEIFYPKSPVRQGDLKRKSRKLRWSVIHRVVLGHHSISQFRMLKSHLINTRTILTLIPVILSVVSGANFNNDQESLRSYDESPDSIDSNESKTGSFSHLSAHFRSLNNSRNYLSSPDLIQSTNSNSRANSVSTSPHLLLSKEMLQKNRPNLKYNSSENESEDEELSSIDFQASKYEDYEGDCEDHKSSQVFCPVKPESDRLTLWSDQKHPRKIQRINSSTDTTSPASSRSTGDSSPAAQNACHSRIIASLRRFQILPWIWRYRISFIYALLLAVAIQFLILPN